MDKIIRIAATWALFYLIGFIIATVKVALSDTSISYLKYFEKSFANIASFAFYYTIIDMGFVIAVPLLNPDFDKI